MLSDRRQRVLAALIEEYVVHALPVGSRTLVEHYGLGVSSATVRNELSVLEDDGYITQPHTSAGRVPTDFGYRSFVDRLLADESIDERSDERMEAAARELRSTATELDSLLEKTSSAIASLTNCLSIVVPPSARALRLRQLSFISLSPRQCLIVAVGDDGQVLNRHVEFAEDVPSDDLARAQNLINEAFAGRSFSEISRDAGLMRLPKNEALVRLMIDETSACLDASAPAHARKLGLSTLLRQPEFQQSRSLMPVLRLVEDDTVLFELMDGFRDDAGAIVRIGSELGEQELSGVSVVASRFGPEDTGGIVAVIGPTRMDYAQAIRAVRIAQRALEEE